MSPDLLNEIDASSIAAMEIPWAELLADSLYYPSSGIDGTPIRHWRMGVNSFVYADFLVSRDDYGRARRSIVGYEPVAQREIPEEAISPLGWRSLMPEAVEPREYLRAMQHSRVAGERFFALWTVFQRRPGRPDWLGPPRFSLLHIRAEGVATYNALYARRRLKPKVICFIRPGLAFGFNFRGYEAALAHAVQSNPAGAPEQLLWEQFGSTCDKPEPPFDALYPVKMAGPLHYDGGNNAFVWLFSQPLQPTPSERMDPPALTALPTDRRLSKSRLIDLRQCAKRLWLEVYRRELREDDPSTRARMEVGNEVGALARNLHDPEGIGKLFDAQRDGYEAVFEASQRALGERRPLFEAGYRAGPVFAFVDVLLPDEQGGGWKLVEVKSSASVKPYHRDDLAVQVHILQEAGVRLTGAAVACIDSSWVYPGGSDYGGLLKQEEMLQEARARGDEVRQWAAQAEAVLRESEPPAIEMGAHCQTPFACPYIAHCTASAAHPGEPVSAPVQWLPQVRTRSLKARLAEPGVVSMEQVDDALLNDLQRRVKRATLTGEPWADAGAASDALSKVRWPLHFLDFEAVNPAVPRWPGTRPFQQIPFQYSLHVLHEDGRLEHREFLDLSGDDPRPALALQLLRDISPEGVGTVLAYNASFEAQVLGALAQFVADVGVPARAGDGGSIAQGLRALRERLMDLLPVARNAWYHPAQQGSWSIKRVLPTLTEGAASYDDLEGVADGQQAVQAYLRATSPGADVEEVESIRQALRKYCEEDTRAMVALWGHLVGIARGAP